jgi:Protein of unknown function (DUF732)
MMAACYNIARLVGTAMVVAALGLTTPGSAAAFTATDGAFLKKLFADGVNFSQPELALGRAREVCEAFGAGMSPESVHAQTLRNSAFSPRQTAIFMADAVQAYCPRYADLFIS